MEPNLLAGRALFDIVERKADYSGDHARRLASIKFLNFGQKVSLGLIRSTVEHSVREKESFIRRSPLQSLMMAFSYKKYFVSFIAVEERATEVLQMLFNNL